MWYIMEVPWFFLFNVFATTLILTVLCFSVPPLINWLEDKMNKE